VILLLVTVLLNRVTLNSKNSSKPPASAPNRKKGQRKKSDKSSGGQKSHIGTTLQKIEEPDEIEIITYRAFIPFPYCTALVTSSGKGAMKHCPFSLTSRCA
jgi:hypothetical protein